MLLLLRYNTEGMVLLLLRYGKEGEMRSLQGSIYEK